MERESVKGAVRKWLDEQGYPLELEVARELRRVGARVWQSEYYTDPETGRQREIDVVGTFSRLIPGKGVCRFEVVVECKLARKRPWIVFTTETTLSDKAFVAQRAAASRQGHIFLDALADDERASTLPLLQNPTRAGYGITEAFTSGTDVPYSAAMSAAKAAQALAASHNNARGLVCILSVPAIVIDGLLVECYLDPGQESPSIEVIDGAVLIWRQRLTEQPHTIISLLTNSLCASFAEQCRSTADAILNLMEEQADNVMRPSR